MADDIMLFSYFWINCILNTHFERKNENFIKQWHW
jgi:hypothetical protein